MSNFVVITQINASGQVYPVGSLINGTEFTPEQIQEQIRLQVIRPATEDERPEQVPGQDPAEQPNGE